MGLQKEMWRCHLLPSRHHCRLLFFPHLQVSQYLDSLCTSFIIRNFLPWAFQPSWREPIVTVTCRDSLLKSPRISFQKPCRWYQLLQEVNDFQRTGSFFRRSRGIKPFFSFRTICSELNVSNMTIEKCASPDNDIIMCGNDTTTIWISRMSVYRLYFTWMDLGGILLCSCTRSVVRWSEKHHY